MNIVVCVKQAPAPADARIDEVTRTLVREGVRLVISSLDRRALLEGLRLRDEVGGTVTALSMGPPQARTALVECLALGADRAVHLSDKRFAGSDTLATSRALADALRRLGPDLVLCGRFTIDSETGQVPAEVAELLDLPQITSARKITPDAAPGVLSLERETDDGYEQYEVTLPAVVSVTEFIITTRRPTPEELEAAEQRPVETWTAEELGGNRRGYGAAGSPTWVGDLRPADFDRGGTVVSGEDPEEAARQLADFLVGRGIFEPGDRARPSGDRRPVPTSADPNRAVWVVAEPAGGRLPPVTFELLGAAQGLAHASGGEVAAVIIGGDGVKSYVADLGAYGADVVYVAADQGLEAYDTEAYTDVLASAVQRLRPWTVLLASAVNGRDLAPRVAARLQIGLTGDAVGLELDAEGRLAALKPAFGGSVVSPIYSRTEPVMATVRPGVLSATRPDRAVEPRVESLPAPQGTRARIRRLRAVVDDLIGASRLEDADVVVAVGMGIGGPEGVPTLRELADVTGGALAATLRVASAGWLPAQLQVGLTGKTVAPRFYIAVGVSGQPTHLTGSKKAEHVVAINSDPEAPMFKAADFGVVGDWAQVVPALTQALRSISTRG